MKLTILSLIFAGLLAAAPICDFACLSPGAANQAVCAPVAANIAVDIDEAYGIAHATYSAHNGTLLERLTFEFTGHDAFTWTGSIHSNDGTALIWLPYSPVQIERIVAAVRGIGGPERYTQFAAECDDCGATPEPVGTAGLVVLVVAAAIWRSLR